MYADRESPLRARIWELEEIICGMVAGRRLLPDRLEDAYSSALLAYPETDEGGTLPRDWDDGDGHELPTICIHR